MSVSGSKRLFVQLPQGKNCTEPTEFLGERGLLKSVGSLSLVQVPRRHRSLCAAAVPVE